MIIRVLCFFILLSLGACQAERGGKRPETGTSTSPPSSPASAQESTAGAIGPASKYGGSYRLVRFHELPSWPGKNLKASWHAWIRNCARLKAMKPDADLGGKLHPSDLAESCMAAAKVDGGREEAIKAYFEHHFQPYAGDGEGKFTGYFEPVYQGSRKWTEKYQYPLYKLPRNPKVSRRDINQGKLAGKELVYLQNPVDIFILQIQGSALIHLAEGGQIRVGYAGNNGAEYLAIGKPMADAGLIRREKLSLQSITHWLKSHPKEAKTWMDLNPRYIFFHEIKGKPDGPLGAMGVPLTAGHSLAIDPAFTPLGVPLWLVTTWPRTKQPLTRLVMAQDKGAAIKGPMRGDLFWGSGEKAALDAGPMNESGKYYILLPVR